MWEAIAVVATGVLHIICVDGFGLKTEFIFAAGGGWLAYLAVRAWRDPSTLGRWGLRREGFRETWRATLILGGVGLSVLPILGALRGELTLRWHMLPLLALYPVWGVIQQLLVLGVFVGNLTRDVPALRPRWRIALLAGCAFGLTHWPEWPLVAATFVLGSVYTLIWLRWRNLWPLGLWHGWLGVPAYFWLLGRDPWIEAFG